MFSTYAPMLLLFSLGYFSLSVLFVLAVGRQLQKEREAYLLRVADDNLPRVG